MAQPFPAGDAGDERDGATSTSDLRERVKEEEEIKKASLTRLRRNSFHVSDLGEDGTGAHIDYTRVRIDHPVCDSTGHMHDADARVACEMLDNAMALRQRWQGKMVVVDPDAAAAAGVESPASSPRRTLRDAKQRQRAPEYNPFATAVPPASAHTFRCVNGVYEVMHRDEVCSGVPSVEEFYRDLKFLAKITAPGPVTTYSYKRLQV